MKQLKSVLGFMCAIIMLTGVQAHAETINTRIGDVSFTHDFANGYPTDETVSKH